jgi:glycosyltransferase involved in cell wall biosynthesis
LIDGVLNTDRIRDAHSQAQQDGVRADYVGDGDRLLVFVGRLSEEKNIPGLISILSELPPSYQLVVVGDGPERDTLRREIADAGVKDQVTVCGQLSHEDALAIIAASDGLVLPSHTEAYPTVVFEGLALGCTVFSTPVGILPGIDHPCININPVAQIPDIIQNTQFEQTQKIDTQTLEKYSMEQFADQILGTIEA